MRHWSVVILLAGTGKVDRSCTEVHTLIRHSISASDQLFARLVIVANGNSSLEM